LQINFDLSQASATGFNFLSLGKIPRISVGPAQLGGGMYVCPDA
jgi:hypothetical protein